MKPKDSKLTISVDMNSTNLVKKLNAIAKHSKALADDLEQIDKSVCPECGETLTKDTLHSNGEVFAQNVYCSVCRYQENDSL